VVAICNATGPGVELGWFDDTTAQPANATTAKIRLIVMRRLKVRIEISFWERKFGFCLCIVLGFRPKLLLHLQIDAATQWRPRCGAYIHRWKENHWSSVEKWYRKIASTSFRWLLRR